MPRQIARLVALLVLLAGVLAVASCGGDARAAVAVRPATADGDSVWVVAAYTLPARFPESDQIVVDYYRGSTYQGYHLTRAPRDSMRIATEIAPGETTTFHVCTYVARGAVKGAKKCAAPVAWTRPELGPDTTGTPEVRIVGVIVWPDSVHLVAGQTQQFCAYLRYSDGSVVPASNMAGIPVCDSVGRTLPGYVLGRVPRHLQREVAFR